MKITQISVFLENKQGRIHDVCALLGKSDINIRALTVAESKEFGILRLVVDNPPSAMAVLKKAGFVAQLTDIVAVEVDDQPGGLARILKTLADDGINVEYMYGFLEKQSDKALLVFRFDRPDQAIVVSKKHKIPVVGNKEIESL